MSSLGPRRPVAPATRWLAVILGVIVGFVLAAGGSGSGLERGLDRGVDRGLDRALAGLAGHAALEGDQAWNHAVPGQPRARLLDAGLEQREDDSDDERSESGPPQPVAFEFAARVVPSLAWVDSGAHPRTWGRRGHGARGPPSA